MKKRPAAFEPVQRTQRLPMRRLDSVITKLPRAWSFKEKAKYWFFFGLSRLIGTLPHDIAARLGRLMGRILYPLAGSRRRIIRDNLDLVYGDGMPARQKERIAFRSFVRMFEDGFMLNASFMRWPRATLRMFTRIDEHHLKEALASGRGAVLLGAHISNFCMGIGSIGYLGYDLCVAVRSLKSRPAEKLFKQWREHANLKSFDQKSGTLSIVRHLAQGGVLWLAMDQNARSDVMVDFLGHPATTFAGPIKLARKFRIPIIPCFVHRVGHLRFEMQFKKPIWLADVPSGNADETLAEDLKKVISVTEAQIRRYPDEWFWFHRRWRATQKKGLVPTSSL